MARIRPIKQLEFEIRSHGGRRKGAGRKKTRLGEPNHVRREVITARTPVHVTLKLQPGLPSLRRPKFLRQFAKATAGARKSGLRVIHFSLQPNHLHMLAEADDNLTFARGMQSLTIRLAKAIRRELRESNSASESKFNSTAKSLDRTSAQKIFLGRYHARVLKTPTEVKHALIYVLQNTAKHLYRGSKPSRAAQPPKVLLLDPFSSLHMCDKPGLLFGAIAKTSEAREFFKRGAPIMQQELKPFLSKPKSWLLTTGWLNASTVI